MSEERVPRQGWRIWGGDRCEHCCNGDRCDDSSHYARERCPYCLGTGDALWLLPQYSGATPSTDASAGEGVKP